MSDRPPEYLDVDEEDLDVVSAPQPHEEHLIRDEGSVTVERVVDEDFEDEEVTVDEDEDEDDIDNEEDEADEEDEEDEDEASEDEDEDEDEEEEEEEGFASQADDVIGRAAAVLKYIVEHIVDDPTQISIGATSDDRGPVLLLSVAEDDRGKIIGRQGRIVQAIRTVVKAATVGTGERVSVEIVD